MEPEKPQIVLGSTPLENSFLDKLRQLKGITPRTTAPRSGSGSVGPASFYPSDDEAAKSILARIGGTEDIIVVPDSVQMSGENPALTMKGGSVDTYKNTLREEAGKKGLDAAGIANRVVENTILVKKSLMDSADLNKTGTIWHEHGHVIFDPAETGRVFAHEIGMIHDQLGKDALATWIKDTRSLAYLARYISDPGIEELRAVLERVLDREDYDKYVELRYNVVNKTKVAPKEEVKIDEVVIAVGQAIEGNIFDFRERLKTAPDAVIEGELKLDSIVTFAGIKWKIEMFSKDDEPDYSEFKLRRQA